MTTGLNYLLTMCVAAAILVDRGCVAIRVTIRPEKMIATTQKSAEISCVTDGDLTQAREITMIEIAKDDADPIVFLRHCSNITYGDNIDSRFEAKGRISQDEGRGYLNLTLWQPRTADTGAYGCVIYYIDRAGHLKEQRMSKVLLVENLDVTALETVLNQLQSKVRQIETGGIAQQDSSPVAFAAHLDTSTSYNSGEVMVLPTVILRQGQGYDEKTGIFTAPKPCLYVFHVSAYMGCSNCYIVINLMVNDVMKGKVDIGDQDFNINNSGSFVTSLGKGDKVKLKVDPDIRSAKVRGSIASMFSGYCVTPM